MSENAATHKHTNRLAEETSPYLLQHAHNPVDWYPWGPEAFEKARREEKPIFLSVGYSTCYWCHVMERQSFENEQIAEEMNRRFVNIKVDREERPDVDQLYMLAVQVLTRHGGWPMSVFLTPDLRPFYGGTYYPPTDQQGRPGFLTVLRGIDDAWRERREEVNKSADGLVNILRQISQPAPPSESVRIDLALIDRIIERSISDYDSQHGGFGRAPKFPRQTLLELLLVYADRPSNARLDSQAIERNDRIGGMLRHTLDAMADGGIRDHLGGGFHRYSTDNRWLVPHFEIMLYDNAMLAWVYAEAYRQFEVRRYAKIARGICDFVLREMTSPQGAFYTAFDAEVDAREGLTYLWTKEQIEQVLTADEAKLFNKVYGVDQGPNFADPHHGTGQPDQNILFLPRPLEAVAVEMSIEEDALDAQLEPMRQKLYAARRTRKQPLLDTKIITSWNGLMIRALSRAGEVLQEQRYLDAAAAAADFLLRGHRTQDGDLIRTSGGGGLDRPLRVRQVPATEEYVARSTDEPTPGGSIEPPDAEVRLAERSIAIAEPESRRRISGFVDDYAGLMQALLALRRASGLDRWRDHAGELAVILRTGFADEAGGFYFTERDAPDILIRQKIATDSPLPSGNALAAMALIELDRPDDARAALSVVAQQLQTQPESMSAMVEAALLYLRRHEAFDVKGAAAGAADRPLSPEQLAAGVVSIKPAWRTPQLLNVHLNILKGFHINAHEAGKGLTATQLLVAGDLAEEVESVAYPPGELLNTAFADEPIRVYSEEAIITVSFKRPMIGQPPLRLALTYQPCDDNACLPPVTRQIEVTAP